jgi:hypothetical protein
MYRTLYSIVLSFLCVCSFAQGTPGATDAKDVDPLALDVLKAATQPIQQARAFTFKALIAEEQLSTSSQIVTFFHTVDIAVQRPDKAHLIFQGRGERVDFYGSKGSIAMYSPQAKLYMIVPAKATIDENLAELPAKGISIPVGPFLNSHLFELASKNLITGYVVGRVKIYDKEVHQLAFTSEDVDWQLWVTGGDSPRIIRAESISKKLEGKPRTIVQFLEWNLSPKIPADEFSFSKPADARQIDMLTATGGK